jgi:2-dehydropantoate 2-reductase
MGSVPKKISVVGAGALGTLIGGLIKHHRPELELTLLSRGSHGRQMKESGQAVLQGFWGRCSVAVTASNDYRDIAGSDLVLFTVKSQDTAEMAGKIAPHLGQAVVVSLQNGINQQTLLQFVRPDRLLVGMTATNMALIQPGVVSLQRNGVSVIGSPTQDVPPSIVTEARDTLALSGLKFDSSDQILGVQYNKLLMNTVGYASVLSASDFVADGILCRPWRNHVALPLLREGLSAIDAAGIRLQRTSGISDVIRFQRLLHALNAPWIDRAIRWTRQRILRPEKIVYSVYQDLLRGKLTEIDFVNGQIVALADRHDVAAPCNRLVVQMIHELEQHHPQQFPTHEQVISRFRDL